MQELIDEIATLKALIAEQAKTIETLREEIARLKNRSSRNSSQPPSLDFKPNRKGGPKGGAVKGHKSHQRSQINPDKEVVLHCDSCPRCGKEVRKTSAPNSKFQWSELEDQGCQTTEFIRPLFYCPCCRQRFSAPLPKGVGPSPFGPKLQAMVTTLTGGYQLSKRQAGSLIQELLGIHLCCGVISKIESRASKVLEKAYIEIKKEVLEGTDPVYVDETGWRHAGKRAYIWQASTDHATLLQISDSRNRASRDKLLGESFSKPIVTDRYSAYSDLVAPHQYCLAHLARDCNRFAECKGTSGFIGKELLDHLKKAFCHWKDYRKGEIDHKQLCSRIGYRRRQIRGWLTEGFCIGSDRLHRFSKGLLKDFDRLWTFLWVAGMQPTNNLAERDLRPMVLWRKRSNGTRGTPGKQFVALMGSVVQTLRKQKRSIFRFLSEAFSSMPFNQPYPVIFS